MLTRCPACATGFRVSTEQINARGGMVRCGRCMAVFNAIDHRVPGGMPEADPIPPEVSPPPVATPQSVAPAPSETPAPVPVHAEPVRTDIEAPASPPSVSPTLDNAPHTEPEPPPETASETLPQTQEVDPVYREEEAPAVTPAPQESEEAAVVPPSEVRDAALAAGLVAAREATEIPGYDKWAEGAFTGAALYGAPPVKTMKWPFVLASLLLVLVLAAQAVYHYRTELALAAPVWRTMLDTVCHSLGCDIPLPRHSEMLSIETSDLQTDPARGGSLLLTATLKNRALYAQAWPHLEITLTNAQDATLVRRVVPPADYLPPQADPTVFPPNSETALRLWLDAKELVAAGYRLYVFYP